MVQRFVSKLFSFNNQEKNESHKIVDTADVACIVNSIIYSPYSLSGATSGVTIKLQIGGLDVDDKLTWHIVCRKRITTAENLVEGLGLLFLSARQMLLLAVEKEMPDAHNGTCWVNYTELVN